MRTLLRSASLLLLASAALSGRAALFTDETSFLAAAQTGFYAENFDGFNYGNPLTGAGTPSYVAPGANGYGWTANAPGGLYALVGRLSSLSAASGLNDLTLTFTGAPVTAFGARVATMDAFGSSVAGLITLRLSDGQTQTLNVGTGGGFLGYSGPTAIVSATFSARADMLAIDHVLTGSSIYAAPAASAPGPMAALPFALMALRRRKRAR